MSWMNGTVYQGSFFADMKQGYGTLTWPDKRKYEGYWFNGKQHGEGHFTNSTGSKQKGYWKAGKIEYWINDLGECIMTTSEESTEVTP